MKKSGKLAAAVLGALGLFTASGAPQEMLRNRDFTKMQNGVPTGWIFRADADNTAAYRVVPGEKAVCITSKETGKSGTLCQERTGFRLPAGSKVTLSGEYRTKDMELGAGPQHLFTSMLMRYRTANQEQPQVWLAPEYQPSETWAKFTDSRRLPVEVEFFGIYAAVMKAKGQIFYRNLSLQVEPSTKVPNPKAEYIWREAEEITRGQNFTDWGRETPGYFSGRGGVGLKNGKFEWTVDIAPVTDEIKLNSVTRTWHVWARMYGYLDHSRIFLRNNGKYINYADVPANEKVDAAGKYAGPGSYLWVYFGSFSTQGGVQKISFESEKRMCFDAVLLTTDDRYCPQKFEARKMPQAKSHDVSLNHMMRAEYVNEGVTETVPLPLSFRGAGDNIVIPGDQAPALFHVTLPENIKIKAVSSHLGGEKWNIPSAWGTRYMTCQQTGTRTIDGVKCVDYVLPLYCVTTNQYLIWIQADKGTLKPKGKTLYEYWLEHNGEKQSPTRAYMNHVDLTPAKPFKKIFIGPSYVHYPMIYQGMPDLYNNMKALGLNYFGGWHDFPWTDPGFADFTREVHANGFRLSVCVPIYQGIRDEDRATGLDGKPVTEPSGGETKIVSLVFDENTPYMKQSMDIIRKTAALGISVEFDDEMNNVLDDKIDYSEQTAALFKAWLTGEGKAGLYKHPREIVKNKKADAARYDLWVAFKCARTAYRYSLFRKAFDEGVAQAEAAGKYDAKFPPLMITCIEGSTRQFKGIKDIRERCYYDFNQLAKYCDVIGVMTYSYAGMAQAGVPAATLAQHNIHTGKYCTGPVLLSGGYSCEPEDKLRMKYEILDSLMEKPKVISFYAGATLFNAPTMAPVTEAIRIAQPYEEFFVEGERYTGMSSRAGWLTLRGLKLGKKLLIYAANYQGAPKAKAEISVGAPVKKVTAVADNSAVPVAGGSFTFHTAKERGQMFLVELE